MFKGSMTALVTPFENGEIDWDTFEALIERQIANGTSGVVPCGTTGESPTLTHDEHHALVKRCVEIVDGRIQVIAGAGSNSTREAIAITKHAQDYGADAAMVVLPYYNKPTQAGLIAHYTAIHDATDIPIIIYAVPGRTVIDMDVETLAELSKLPRIVGMKDATDDAMRPIHVRKACGDDFSVLSGEDGPIAGFLAQGGHGIISVLANVAPKESADLHKAWQERDLDAFFALRDRLAPVSEALFCETSPQPVKYALHLMGLCKNELRRPLVPASDMAMKTVETSLRDADLI